MPNSSRDDIMVRALVGGGKFTRSSVVPDRSSARDGAGKRRVDAIFR